MKFAVAKAGLQDHLKTGLSTIMALRNTSQKRYVVHCVAEKKGGHWQAFSLEFGLAVQADSFADAKDKLDGMIYSYLYDALVGEDRAHAKELLGRKAHWRVYLRYCYAWLAHALRHSMNTKVFRESLGAPQLCT